MTRVVIASCSAMKLASSSRPRHTAPKPRDAMPLWKASLSKARLTAVSMRPASAGSMPGGPAMPRYVPPT